MARINKPELTISDLKWIGYLVDRIAQRHPEAKAYPQHKIEILNTK